MAVVRRIRLSLLTCAVAALAFGFGSCAPGGTGTPYFFFRSPQFDALSLAGTLPFELALPPFAEIDQLAVTLDGAPLDTSAFAQTPSALTGSIPGLAAGRHTLGATAKLKVSLFRVAVAASTSFELAALDRPDECEVLNNVECMLPYPSSRFLEPAATPTGWRLAFPVSGMPKQNGGSGLAPLSVEPYRKLDGFSPTVQVLMNFPGGVDLALSNASRLIPGLPGDPNARSYGTRSLDADSPTVLIDADTGEHILHFTENDARAVDPARVVTFLRPGRSLLPGHRYIVAVRGLLHADGTAVAPEAPFAALRDRRPIAIPSLAARRAHFEDVFARLAAAGVPRANLVLAFDFTVQSDEGLTAQMLSMRDQAFAWLAAQTQPTFTISQVETNDCTQPGVWVWKKVYGTYQVPLFLTDDPVLKTRVPGTLNVDAAGHPVQNGFTNPPFSIGIPCTVLANGGTPTRPMLFGHGLFGKGRDIIGYLDEPALKDFDFVVGATDWRGLSNPDLPDPIASSYIGKVIFDLNLIDALPDRLRQGMLNTLVLGRLLKTGAFNASAEFRTPEGVGVIATDELYYFGASLGGILGTMFAGLTPDIERANVDVPGINFSFLLQRATPFLVFQDALTLTGVDDPMTVALGLSVIHELWVRGEPASLATHVTSNPLPGSSAKKILMTEAFLDQQVSNQDTEIAARTLGLPQLVGSLQPGLAEIPDAAGPLDSAYVIYDTGSFDLTNPAHEPFIPPLSNLQATPNRCDPHPRRGFIPASVKQLLGFLQPGGKIENFCNGRCDADATLDSDGLFLELPFGEAACDPLGS